MRERPRGIWTWALGGVAFLAIMAVLAAILGLGPFREPELSGGELIAQGDEICQDAHEAFVELQRSPPATASDAAELTDGLVDIAAGESERLAALNGSPELEAEMEEYLAAREDGIAALRAGRDAAESNDAEAYAASQADAAASRRDGRAIARRIGFAICSRPLRPGA